MANMTWTKEQQQVIDTRGRNLLVSAAAGSGKTAVLVERIIRMVTDPEHPVDIDRLLVMTFTNAAAAEMRERIGDALERQLEEHPGDRNLERQATLIHHARITTIDSFCLGLLREHFNELDIDPGFRIGDEGELLLLQADVMKELLEDYYSQADARFLRFVDTYASGKADGGLEDYIMQIVKFSQSNPWPKEWIEACRDEFCGDEQGAAAHVGAEEAEHDEGVDLEASGIMGDGPRRGGDGEADDKELAAGEADFFQAAPWMQYLIADVHRQADEFAEQLQEAIDIASEEDGPQVYLPMLTEDQRAMERLCAAETYEEITRVLSGPLFGRLAAVRGKNVDPEKKEIASDIRGRVKDAVKKMRELYVPSDPEHIYRDLMATREPVLVLLELAEAFIDRFQEAKKEKNLVDFNDLEHFALDILTGGSEGHEPGPVADELAKFYEEILVDEYQDSNEVQETLIRAISRERFGSPNVFMVGDVKQSIYKFRLAKPEIFLEKYETYSKEESPYQKIELDKNFRSRGEVLHSINDVFFQIMTKALGNIRYTDETALYAAAAYPETPRAGQAKTEVYLLNTGEDIMASMDDEAADYTAKEAEARLIAEKIRELTHPETGMQIWNAKAGQYEPLRRKDIVILLRSLSGWAEAFLSVLSAEGIPAFAESRMGYFTAMEVETVLNMLSIIDNPMQDIPLVGVLKSPIGGFDNRELAIVMSAFKQSADKGQDVGFYGAVKMYLERGGAWNSSVAGQMQMLFMEDGEVTAGTDERILQKLQAFWELLMELRGEAGYLPVHRLISRIFERTGYYDYVSAMPAGKVRQANLDMLIEKAAAFEKTSYQSLFDFIRYIEKMKKYNTDFGEASRISENDDTVRIMSIHKSKGLEFPVVFLAGAGKNFNRQDSRGKILIDEALGVATDFIDPERKIKAATLKKNVLGRRSNLESMGEELRILYVAMTRAKEKLIITAGDKYLDKRLERWTNLPESATLGDGLPFTYLSAANSYLDWILMASGHAKGTIAISQVPMWTLVHMEAERQEEKSGIYGMLQMLREGGSERTPRGPEEESAYEGDADAGVGEPCSDGREASGYQADIETYLNYRYPHEADIALHAKMSVSELKSHGQFTDDAESDFLPTIPKFMREAEMDVEATTILERETPLEAAQGETVKEMAFEVTTDVPKQESDLDASGAKTLGKGTVVHEASGTSRGTAYHRVLELIDFKSIRRRQDIYREFDRIRESELMPEESLRLVWVDKIWKFFESDLAKRMQRADERGQLRKESQFVMGIPARLMDEADSDETVLIQGIIDAWFEEDGNLVLADYKTDCVNEGEEQILRDRYQIQMVYYAQALQQITGKPVTEAVIYSLALQKMIPIEIFL